ncbi:hypothetical protein KKF61_03955 [Patescibacteria group bacterium]|nr:hypothetical protein [Patescibacteria group bacterium]MBU0964383.1 hypothetical protein [Patescibacteria group bacterium]
MLNKILKFIFIFSTLLFFALPVSAKDNDSVEINFFYSDTCPHCAKEEVFLDGLEQELGDTILISRYEVSDKDNLEIFEKFIESSGQEVRGVPATFIGDKEVIVGFNSSTDTGQRIRNVINECLSECPADNSLLVDLPLFGETDLSKYSLFGLTAVVAAIDGFNPCAMWVLIILIGFLLGMENRRRMWTLGLTFIAASALVYFIFLAAWLKFFQFIGVVRPVQIIIGLVAISVAIYYFRRFWKSRPGECEVTNVDQRRKITVRMKAVIQKRSLLLALIGIIGLAFVVNLIELACSAGLPAIFAQVLALSDLPSWQYYFYLLLYVIIFMLDDMIVFAIAMITMKAAGTTGKYSRYATLIGAIVILFLGLLLMLKPEWIMFG